VWIVFEFPHSLAAGRDPSPYAKPARRIVVADNCALLDVIKSRPGVVVLAETDNWRNVCWLLSGQVFEHQAVGQVVESLQQGKLW
jgi:hypothetical protein